jgi:ribonuclease BN (tRNA processing enzyme)
VLDVEALVGGACYDVGVLQVEAARVLHTEDSYAFRVELPGADTGLVYSGDCGRAEDLDRLIRPGDAILTEVSFGPGPVTPGAAHLDGPAVGHLAARTAAGRVLLTHLQMGYDEGATIDSVRAQYDGSVAMVWPGERYVIGA